jgi:hypothetical protein
VALRESYNTLSQEFDGFLYAPIGEERNGMTLSVISAFARLDIDAWREAARLSKLPTQMAVEALAPIIARLPVGQWNAVDIPAIARRLVDALPRRDALIQSVATSRTAGKMRPRIIYVIVMVLLATAYFGVVARRQLPSSSGDTPTTTSGAPN